MRIRLNRIIFISFLLVTFLIGSAQKIFYAPGNENQGQNIPEDSTELLYTVYLLGDIKHPLPDSKNLKLLKKKHEGK